MIPGTNSDPFIQDLHRLRPDGELVRSVVVNLASLTLIEVPQDRRIEVWGLDPVRYVRRRFQPRTPDELARVGEVLIRFAQQCREGWE